MKNAPCYKCKRRKVNCHATCKDYSDYRAEIEKEKEDNSILIYTEYIINTIHKRRKRKNEKHRN